MFILRWLVYALVILAMPRILKGVEVKNFTTSLIVALVLGILNVFIKPFLILLTLPITVLTLGLFVLVINAFLVWLASAWIPGFKVKDFTTAFLFALVLAIINMILG